MILPLNAGSRSKRAQGEEYTSQAASRVLRAMLCNARQCWEQAIAACAMAELNEEELLLCMCHDIITRQRADGRLCDVENTPTVTDPSLCIAPLLRAAEITGDCRYTEAVDRNLRYLLREAPRAKDGVLYHIQGTSEVWADSAAMTPANLVRMGHREFGLTQMEGILRRLRRTDGLYAHKWNDATNGYLRKAAWSAGNGWISVGLAWLILELDPMDARGRDMLYRFEELTQTLERYRLPNGLFRNIIDDPDSFVECEGAAMHAYATALLAEAGRIAPERLNQPREVLATPKNHVDTHGYVRDCAGSPSFETPGTSTEMQAFFLMLNAVLERA